MANDFYSCAGIGDEAFASDKDFGVSEEDKALNRAFYDE